MFGYTGDDRVELASCNADPMVQLFGHRPAVSPIAAQFVYDIQEDRHGRY